MKQFTSVLFGLVLVLSINSNAQKTIAMCTKEVDIDACYTCCSGVLINQNTTNQITGVSSTQQVEDPKCARRCDDTFPSSKESKLTCAEAQKDYAKANEQNPCPTAANSKACYEKIESCKASTGLAGVDGLATGNENIDSLANSALEMIKATQAAKQNSATDVQADRSCYSSLRVGDKAAAKERKSRQDQIKKDIEAADKERREANERLSKETNETKVEQQKLQAETTKTLQKLDVEKREKLTKMNEELQKAGTEIRKQTTEIVKIKQAMEKMKFENQKTMLAYTEEKINQQCKSALDTAKVCFVKASKGVKFSKEDTCSNFTFSGSGTKGTAELKRKLKQVNDACFEQSNQSVSTLKYEYADKVRTYEMDIKEKQEQIADANKALEAKKTENEAITKETDTQKSQEQKSLEEQMANFAEKLTDLQKTTTAAIKSSEEKIALLNIELKDLKAGALADETNEPGSQAIYDNIANDASIALGAITSASGSVYAACCNGKDRKPGASADCAKLNAENTAAVKASKQKAKDKSNK